MLRFFSRTILTLLGWKVEYVDPGLDKYVLIGAPHTSNWDFPLTLLGISSMDIRFNWVAKHSLFRWPLGGIFRAIGGIPVNRSTGTGFLKSVISLFNKRDRCILAIAPEGTRSSTSYWKTGFYTIAVQASVPIVMGYVDYEKKMVGITGLLRPTGDIEEDFVIIKDFYKNRVGKFPAKQGEICLKVRKRSTKENAED